MPIPRQAVTAVSVVLACALAGCASAGRAAAPATTFTPSPASPASASGSPAQYPPGWTLPNTKLTPGALQPGVTLKDLCPHVSPALEALRPGSAAKHEVYVAYGITRHGPGAWEVDHLVPVELGGLVSAPAGDVTENLWPEPPARPDPAVLRKYHLDPAYAMNSKDALEDVLHSDVCAGTVPLATAQRAIASDWRAAYAQYVGKPA